MIFVFLLLARKSAEEKGDIGGKEKKRITIEKRIGGELRWFIQYILLFLPLIIIVSVSVIVSNSERESFPHICISDRSRLCCFNS